MNRAALLPLVDLTDTNPTRLGFHYAAPLLEDAAIYKCALAAREAIATYYADRAVHVSPNGILLTASTSEAYSFLLKLLTEPGDRILVPAPSDLHPSGQCVLSKTAARGRGREP